MGDRRELGGEEWSDVDASSLPYGTCLQRKREKQTQCHITSSPWSYQTHESSTGGGAGGHTVLELILRMENQSQFLKKLMRAGFSGKGRQLLHIIRYIGLTMVVTLYINSYSQILTPPPLPFPRPNSPCLRFFRAERREPCMDKELEIQYNHEARCTKYSLQHVQDSIWQNILCRTLSNKKNICWMSILSNIFVRYCPAENMWPAMERPFKIFHKKYWSQVKLWPFLCSRADTFVFWKIHILIKLLNWMCPSK